MTTHNLLYKECDKHRYRIFRDNSLKDQICGCPRTTRTNGLYVYKHDITGNWVVWDVEGDTWLSLSGSWGTAIKTAYLYLSHYGDEPIRCQSKCSQWPYCGHDWRKWHILVEARSQA